MLLIISLIIVSLFIYFLKDSLKKHAGIYYIGAAVISIAVFLIGFLPMPLFVKNNILGIFAKGSLGTAMFVAVMYAGALPKGSKLIAPLMKIRGELSITAAILVLCHNFTYGMTYFRMLFTKTSLLSATQLAAAVISLVLIAIMLVLTVTSFPSVRKKMQAKKWKQLQRTAYVFYGLMYVHIMLINIPYARLGLGMYIANVVIYSIVFLGYAAMRIAKAVSVKAARAGKTYGKKPETVLYGLALVICAVMTVLCFAGRQTVSATNLYSLVRVYGSLTLFILKERLSVMSTLVSITSITLTATISAKLLLLSVPVMLLWTLQELLRERALAMSSVSLSLRKLLQVNMNSAMHSLKESHLNITNALLRLKMTVLYSGILLRMRMELSLM